MCVQGTAVEVCTVCTRDGSRGVYCVYKGRESRCVLCVQGMGVARGVYCVYKGWE